jgi:hypothetical protein
MEAHEAMITHFTKSEDKVKGTLELNASYTIAEVQTRIATKLGATLLKTKQSPTSAYVYTPDAGTSTYGWKLGITGGNPAEMTLGDPKYDTADKIKAAPSASPAENALNILDCKRDETDAKTKLI